MGGVRTAAHRTADVRRARIAALSHRCWPAVSFMAVMLFVYRATVAVAVNSSLLPGIRAHLMTPVAEQATGAALVFSIRSRRGKSLARSPAGEGCQTRTVFRARAQDSSWSNRVVAAASCCPPGLKTEKFSKSVSSEKDNC
jgi:hypothetical protein